MKKPPVAIAASGFFILQSVKTTGERGNQRADPNHPFAKSKSNPLL